MNDPLLAAPAAAGCGSEALGFAASDLGFERSVRQVAARRSDGMTQAFTGDHRSPAFEWDHDEPGSATR